MHRGPTGRVRDKERRKRRAAGPTADTDMASPIAKAPKTTSQTLAASSSEGKLAETTGNLVSGTESNSDMANAEASKPSGLSATQSDSTTNLPSQTSAQLSDLDRMSSNVSATDSSAADSKTGVSELSATPLTSAPHEQPNEFHEDKQHQLEAAAQPKHETAALKDTDKNDDVKDEENVTENLTQKDSPILNKSPSKANEQNESLL